MKNNTRSFAWGLFGQLPKGQNVFVSPFSVRLALGRAAVGAKGPTFDQMQSVLGLVGGTPLGVANWLSGLETDIVKSKTARTDVANRIYAQTGYPFVPDYMTLMAESVGIKLVDFRTVNEKVRRDINAWVAKATQDKITELLEAGSLDASTRMVLVNAIYAKWDWLKAFSPEMTQNMWFYLLDGGCTEVQMMYQGDTFDYADTASMKVLRLPYKGRRFSRYYFLPAEEGLVALNSMEEEIAADMPELIRSLRKTEWVEVCVPKFKLQYGTVNLVPVLKALGIVDAFDPNLANFSGMVATNSLYVDGVYHQAVVEDNERGSEMAAATAVSMLEKCISRKLSLVANRPFVFANVDDSTGEVLFVGRMVDPTVK